MRKLGVLLAVSSLPSDYGIGTFGKSAYRFARLLKRSGAKVWQILPVNPTGYGDSPYQSCSTFAGNPYFIDLEMLCRDGFLRNEDLPPKYTENKNYVDYGALYKERYATLKKAFDHSYGNCQSKVNAFRQKNEWLDDYALYMALKEKFLGLPFFEWDDEGLKRRDKSVLESARSELKNEIDFCCFVQYLFFSQFRKLKKYVNGLGIELLGDMPVYVSLDSSDVWSSPEMFDLNRDLKPNKVAGVPPDYFSEDGQLWGNPLYDPDMLKATGYEWWIKRLSHITGLYDIVRLDHFIGYARYYAIPYSQKTAKNGSWMRGFGKELFETAFEKLGKLNIIAEDLGILTDDVTALREHLGFPGMRVMEFSYDPYGNSTVLPDAVRKESVIYTGTHDNNTLAGWWSEADDVEKKYIAKLYSTPKRSYKTMPKKLVEECAKSTADLAVIPIQDLLGLGSEARMNTPGTLGDNWKWRVDESALDGKLTRKIKKLVQMSER